MNDRELQFPIEPLTAEEFHVLDCLVEATKAFRYLPSHHPSDMDEWVTLIHQLQEKVMCRAAMRCYPKYFTTMTPTQHFFELNSNEPDIR